jgi:hypothetical protein
MCSRTNPISLALRRLGLDYSVNYRDVCTRRPDTTEDGLDYYITVHVLALPEDAASFMRAFGYSLRGKESKRSFETRKALRRTSSDHKVPVRPYKPGDLVEPFEFEIDLEAAP